MDRPHVGVIVQEIKYVASGSSISFIHISRWCNQTAHVMAKVANECNGCIWLNEAPKLIKAILCNERFN